MGGLAVAPWRWGGRIEEPRERHCNLEALARAAARLEREPALQGRGHAAARRPAVAGLEGLLQHNARRAARQAVAHLAVGAAVERRSVRLLVMSCDIT